MKTIIGRKKEIKKMEALLASSRAEFLAVTGRRRVGKTFLIDALFSEHYCFSMTGIQNSSLANQLANFSEKLSEYDGTFPERTFNDWRTAFSHFKQYLKTLDPLKKKVIFLDELPWMDTPKSGFIQILAHFWNDYLSKQPHFLLVICGSATSWITQKIINDPGGLHNRITENIHLYAFTLPEAQALIQHKGLQYNHQDIAKLYMSLGGIPFYLEALQKGESVAMAIERICFAPTGMLYNEYNNLFQALFNNAALHQTIVAALANQPSGMTHTELLQAIKMKQATGSYQRAVYELIVSDFIMEYVPFGKKKRGTVLKLIDEYCIFYHHFMKPNRKYTQGLWQQLAETQAYKIWAGYAFETLCHKHIQLIKNILQIGAVYTETYSLRVPANEDSGGFQIDLLIDRKDNCMNLCEIKFYSGSFVISKDYYKQLVDKKQRFVDYTGTRKQVFLTFITNHGVTMNSSAQAIVDVQVRLEDFFSS
jgi:AAA+ ATPase superfamily predicted ATPase